MRLSGLAQTGHPESTAPGPCRTRTKSPREREERWLCQKGTLLRPCVAHRNLSAGSDLTLHAGRQDRGIKTASVNRLHEQAGLRVIFTSEEDRRAFAKLFKSAMAESVLKSRVGQMRAPD